MRTSPSFEPTREGEARVVWGGASAYPQGTTRLTQLPEGVCVPAPPVRSQATCFQRLHAFERSTGSIHGVPQRSPTTESSLLAGGWVPRPREGSLELLQVRESLPCCWVSNHTNSECPLCPGLERLGNGGAPKPQAPPRDAVATQRI